MIGVIAAHRADQADIVHRFANVREQIADHHAGFSAWFEFPARADVGSPAGGLEALSSGFDQLGFVVERIDMRDAARHVHEDHALRFRSKVRSMRRERIGRIGEQALHHGGEEQRSCKEAADNLAAGTVTGQHWSCRAPTRSMAVAPKISCRLGKQ